LPPLCFSQEEGKEAADSLANRAQAVQAEAFAFPPAHPGFGVVQEGARVPSTGRSGSHRVLQTVQA